jgi:hypothetical protein
MALQTTLDLNVTALYAATTPPLGVGTVPITANKSIRMLTGVATGQADKIYTLTNTIAASGTATLDLAGSVTDVFGVTFTIVKLKMLIVRALAANTNNVTVGPPASNGVSGLFAGTTPTISIMPGGIFAWAAPGTTAPTVVAATGDLLTFTNSGAGTGVTYDVIVVGTSS